MAELAGLSVGYGCALCVPNGEVNGKPFLLCTERCTAEIRALTVRQPWANAIAYGNKRVENRTWSADRAAGKLIAIHAGKGHDLDAMPPEGCTWPEVPDLSLGAVLAVATVTGSCVPWECDGECSPWAIRGQDHWHLEDVRPLAKPVPCRGALGLWRLPEGVEKAVRAQLGACDV
jgi:hypothetical protein